MTQRLFSFTGGDTGIWQVTAMNVLRGEALPVAQRLAVTAGDVNSHKPDTVWSLRGITSNERYVDRDEKREIVAQQLALARPEASRAALIALRKNEAWWLLTQEERLDIFKEKSHHTAIGLTTFPALARRLHHCRDLSESEPFDFLTWFEYAPAEEDTFHQLLAMLRATEEWRFVDREVDIRLQRADG